MSFLQRAATLAVVSLSLVGLGAQSSAGFAAELDRTALPVPGSTPQSTPAVVFAAPTPVVQALMPNPAPNVSADETPSADVTVYPTLAAAVAAQDVPAQASDEQLRCLAGAIYYESKGEPLAGQLAVAQVILNRAGAGRFGDDVCEVVKQPGQFSFVRGGRIPSIDAARKTYQTALAVAKVAMTDAWDSVAGKALYFHARRVTPGWGKVKIAAIGNHVFYR